MPTKTTTKQRAAPLRLTDRDRQVLEALGSYRFLSIPQLAVLFFPSNDAARKRVKMLHRAGLVVEVFMPVRPHDRSSFTIYAISGRGARIVAERTGGIRPRHLTACEQRGGLFLEHTLRRNDVRICLELLDRELPGFHLLLWRQAKDQVKASAQILVGARKRERMTIVPDGYFVFRYQSRVYGFLLEIDMGTVQRTRMEKRYRTYWRLWKDGDAHKRFGLMPLRVLTLTIPDQKRSSRLETLRKAAIKAPEHGRRGSKLFWFANLEAADIHEPLALLSPCWLMATTKRPQPQPLIRV